MPATVTDAGLAARARKEAKNEALNVSRVVFANVEVGGQTPTQPAATDTKPVAKHIVHIAPLTAKGYINPSQVVYSVMLGSEVGDFAFTWMGFETEGGTLYAIVHTTPQYKRKNVGQNFTRNLIDSF